MLRVGERYVATMAQISLRFARAIGLSHNFYTICFDTMTSTHFTTRFTSTDREFALKPDTFPLSRRQVSSWLAGAWALSPLFTHSATSTSSTSSASSVIWQQLRDHSSPIVLVRHALAPGVGDPPGFVLSDCRTQRNLSDEGRAQARSMGERLRAENIRIGAVWHSQWCRTRETAELVLAAATRPITSPLTPKPEAAFNSFFNDRSKLQAQTAQAKKLLLAWRGPGALVVVTHQVNITALTDVVPQSGEGVALLRRGAELVLAGRLEGL
jgi:phosphohistidine phosphatase SixA